MEKRRFKVFRRGGDNEKYKNRSKGRFMKGGYFFGEENGLFFGIELLF